MFHVKRYQKEKSEMEIVEISPEDLHVNERNSRTHSDEQIDQICASITEFGFTNPILINPDNRIIAGHGRHMAALRLKWDDVPCIVLEGLTEAQERAYVIADNKIALNSSWDEVLLKQELKELKADFDWETLGFEFTELDEVFKEQQHSEKYSVKVEAPIYEPTEELPPDPRSCVDTSKTNQLIADILHNADLSEDIKDLLVLAAHRHAVFDYSKIAELYAHCEPKVQDLMEASALIIIDYDRAIEDGFVQMAGKLLELAEKDKEIA